MPRRAPAGNDRPTTTGKSLSASTRSSAPCRRCDPREPRMPDRVERLREAAQARHEATLRRAKSALASMTRRGEPVTFRRVAETAGVSRSWLYRQQELRDEINRLRTDHK